MAAEDDSDIPDSGAVFTFGKSKFADNLPNKFWVRNDSVRDVACGDEHTSLVAESGRVFTFGSNDWGQLGLGTSITADRPSCIKSLKREKAKLVACGRVHTIVATESGKIYSFGANGEGQLGVEDSPASNVPKCIDSLVEQQYRMLAAGADHSVALTEDGAVFVWGGGSEGQLGLGGKTECPDPEEIDIEDVVTCVSCGYYHTAIVTESGDLYTFGESEGGKLGLGDDPDDTDTPQKVDIPEPVTAVACGGSHTVALTENGNVYTFGDGPSGQLGHGTHFLQISTPRKLNINFKVKSVACGESHTSLISEKGQLYTFGDGRHGKLALGQDSFSNQFTPLRVKRFSKFIVQKVMCGGCHMICLAKPNRESEDLYSSEDEVIGEPKMNGLLNHSLRPDGSIDLNNSVTARDRRRKTNESFKNDLNRTLPPLAGAHKVPREQLHQTVPAPKSRRIESAPPHTQTDTNEIQDEVKEEVIRAENKEVMSSPQTLPKPLPRRHAGIPEPKLEDEDSGEEVDSEEEVKEMSHSTKAFPQAPLPPPRALPKIDQHAESDEDADEEDEHEDKPKKPKGKKQKKKKGKDAGLGIFGRKKTGLSDDEEEEEEEEDDEEEVEEKEEKSEKEEEKEEDEGAKGDKKSKKEKKEKKDNKEKKDKKDKKSKKKDKKKDEEEEEEEEDEEEKKEEKEEDDEEDKKKKGKKDKKGKDKKKDKKDKKKDKKKGKKVEEEEEEEEEKEDEDEDEDEKKDDKKSKKKDKKKDKDKKKKEKDKDEDKEKDEEKKDEKPEDEKEDDKDKKETPPEPPKKKSRTCTIL